MTYQCVPWIYVLQKFIANVRYLNVNKLEVNELIVIDIFQCLYHPVGFSYSYPKTTIEAAINPQRESTDSSHISKNNGKVRI